MWAGLSFFKQIVALMRTPQQGSCCLWKNHLHTDRVHQSIARVLFSATILSPMATQRKATSAQGSTANVNKDLCDALIELADFEKNVSRHMHKYNAYRKVIASLFVLSGAKPVRLSEEVCCT